MSSATAQTVPTEPLLLERILQPGGVAVVFQPIFELDVAVPQLFGLECLVRGPRGSNVERPTVLFDYVRRKHAEAAADRACVAASLAEAASLPTFPRLSVNVHASTLGRDQDFPAFLLDRARAAGIDPARLIVEVGEYREPPVELPCLRPALETLRSARVSIALDDVGFTGSNYDMILDVRPDIYKLDRCLVSSAWSDPYRQVILDSLARMVRRLEGRAVAEGVEDARELIAVQAAGIELVQGFLLSQPLPAADLIASGFLLGRTPAVSLQ
jgi:EAL domain-containing protein (putative c-di-GMP-specific phosphodiesterase class I)